MIVPMRKIVLIIPQEDRSSAVNALRDLGVVHVESVTLPEDARRLHLAAELAEIGRLKTLLESLPKTAKKSAFVNGHSGEALFRIIRDTFAEDARNDREIEKLQQIKVDLLPWGEFDGAMLETLRAKGVEVYLCCAMEDEFKRQSQELGRTCQELSRDGKTIRFAIVSREKLAPETMPLVKLPCEVPLSEINRRLAELRNHRKELVSQLQDLRQELPHLLRHRQELEEALEYLTVRDSLETQLETLLSIGGFVPEQDLGKVVDLAREKGWGLIDREADPNREAVPTLLKTPRYAKLIEPLMKFLAITPGYNERDVSVPVLIFFTIFFGMLVGDAGYGLIFFTVSTVAYAKLHKKRPELRTVLAFLMLLTSSAIAWGALTGNYFGTSHPGLPWLTSDPDKDTNSKLVCFSLALLQLSLGHCIQLFSSNSWKGSLGHFGWILILIGNFILVYNLLLWPSDSFPAAGYWCYGVGIASAAAGDIDWKDAGSVFGFPFSVLGSFVDILSYIRLFAVGMAGFYLAECFNQMTLPLMTSPLGIIGGMLILCLGHSLNICLCAMSVLVHGVRLNALEFSNHVGLRWAGFVFRPFARRKENQIATKS